MNVAGIVLIVWTLIMVALGWDTTGTPRMSCILLWVLGLVTLPDFCPHSHSDSNDDSADDRPTR